MMICFQLTSNSGGAENTSINQWCFNMFQCYGMLRNATNDAGAREHVSALSSSFQFLPGNTGAKRKTVHRLGPTGEGSPGTGHRTRRTAAGASGSSSTTPAQIAAQKSDGAHSDYSQPALIRIHSAATEATSEHSRPPSVVRIASTSEEEKEKVKQGSV